MTTTQNWLLSTKISGMRSITIWSSKNLGKSKSILLAYITVRVFEIPQSFTGHHGFQEPGQDP